MAEENHTTNTENDFFDWMDGYCFSFIELSEGARFEACKEGVKAWNLEYGQNIPLGQGVNKWLRERHPDK